MIMTWFRVFLLNQNRNAASGQHKEEMLHQLRQLAKLDPNFKYENANIEPVGGFQSLVAEPNLQPGNTNTGSERDTELNTFCAYEVKASFHALFLMFILIHNVESLNLNCCI